MAQRAGPPSDPWLGPDRGLRVPVGDDTAALSLPDILVPGLDVVFVGINPSIYSAQRGHYFARPGNRFWSVLHESGLVPERLHPEDDARLPEFGIGLTDIVKRPTRTAAELSPEEFEAGAAALQAKLLQFAPRAVCFVGKMGYEAYRGRRATTYGQQPDDIGWSAVFVMPSSSGRANRLQAQRLACLIALRSYLGR